MQTVQQTGYPSIDKPWLKYYDTIIDESQIPDKSIFQVAYHENKDNLEAVAIDMRSSIADYARGIKITYGELFKRIQESARASFALGIKENDIVPIILPNLPEARILIYSNNILGAVSYPISPMLPVNQLEHIIVENSVKYVFVFKDFYPKYEGALKRGEIKNIVVLDGTESLPSIQKYMDVFRSDMRQSHDNRIINWNTYLECGKSVSCEIMPYHKTDKVTIIVGTSGTTGVPKGVCLTDKNINAVAFAYIKGKVLEGTVMDALMPSIGYGISMMHYETTSGITTYLIPELITKNIGYVLNQVKPDNFPGGPVHYINLLNSKEYKEGSLEASCMIVGKSYPPAS